MGHIPEKHLKVAAPHLLRAYCTGTDAEKMTVEEQVGWVLSLENCAHGGIKMPVDIEDAKSSALICGKSIGMDLSDHETKDEVVAEVSSEVSSEVAEVVAEVSSEVESKIEEEKTEDIKPKASKPKPKASKKSSNGKQS